MGTRGKALLPTTPVSYTHTDVYKRQMDFLCTNGMRPQAARSGAVEGGMAGFYDELHNAASAAYTKKNPDLPGEFRMPHHKYEQALTNDAVLRTSAGPLDLTECIPCLLYTSRCV